jgi:hypothetical protein
MTHQNNPAENEAQLHRLVHDLANSLETILQAAHLVQQSKLSPQDRKWMEMIEAAANDSARINRSIREILAPANRQTPIRRRA